MIIQERDLEIIRYVYKHRFLTTKHIVALSGGSEQVIRRRLRLMYHVGYLDRPRRQIKPFSPDGSDPLVYALGNKGIELLVRNFNIHPSRVDWTSKNREVSQPHIDHDLLVAHFMVCLKLACRQVKGVKLLEPQWRPSDRTGRKLKSVNSLRLKICVIRRINGQNRKVRFTVVPDKVFGLYFVEDLPRRNKTYYFLEADRSTMPVERSNPYLSSYLKKMLGYSEAWREKKYQKIFDTQSVRVLTLAKSGERIRSMIAASRKATRQRQGSGLFLFTQSREITLDNPIRIFDAIWQNGRDQSLLSLIE